MKRGRKRGASKFVARMKPPDGAKAAAEEMEKSSAMAGAIRAGKEVMASDRSFGNQRCTKSRMQFAHIKS